VVLDELRADGYLTAVPWRGPPAGHVNRHGDEDDPSFENAVRRIEGD
jgi:hypothetical protein